MPASKTASSYIVQADLLRIIAILGTLSIHYLYPIYSRPDFLGGTSWWLADLINTLSRPSIPLFIMLSGALLIPKQETVNATLMRTLNRLLIPFLIWASIYFAWDILFFGIHRSPYEFLAMFFTGSVYHLYFLVILIGLYFLLPLIRVIVKSAQPELNKYFIELSLGVGVLMFLAQYLFIPSHPLFSSFTIWIPYLGYFLLGAYLTKPDPYQMKKILIIFLISTIATFFLNYLSLYLFSHGNGYLMKDGISYFDQYLSPNVMSMSITLYMLIMFSSSLKNRIQNNSFVSSVVKELAKTSFAVYIIHFIILNLLDSIGFSFERFHINLILFILIKGILLTVTSFAVAAALIRIPVVKLAFGEKN